MTSPDEMLANWFRNYFRWYDPELVNRITADLRPNWEGIYVYGARAYPLKKEREADKERRAFKVKSRGHIGYLVGYYASNIYKIWVPQLDRVIISRNVRFDEDLLYDPEQEKAEGQPLEIVRATIQEIEDTVDLIQDAGSILENLGLWDTELIEQGEAVQQLGGESGEIPTSQSEAPIQETTATEPQIEIEVAQSQKSGVDAPPIDQSTGLLSPEATPDPESATGPIETGETAGNSEDVAPDDYDSDTIVVDTGRSENEGGEMQELTEHTRTTQDSQGASPPPDQAWNNPTTASAKLKRAYNKRVYDKERSSRRLQGKKPESDDDGGAGSSSVSLVFAVTSETLLATLISAAPAWAVPEHIESFFTNWWSSQEKVFWKDDVFQPVHAIIAQSTHHKPGQDEKARSVLENAARVLPTSLPAIHQKDFPPEPRSWRELKDHPLGVHFKADAELEIRNLEQRNCWKVIPKTEARSSPLPLKWVFTYKSDSASMLTRCRSRLVVRGDLQEDETILSTYAATLASRSFRMAMAIAARFDLEVKQHDVINAFIYASRQSDGPPVTCHMPDGFPMPGMLVEVKQALYGLVDSPSLWYKEFTSTLVNLKLEPIKEEPCIYTTPDRKVFVIFFVDDIQVMYHREDEELAEAITRGLYKAYNLRPLGDVKWFLGVRVVRDRAARKLWLVHDTYIEKITRRFGLLDGKCPSTPLPAYELKKNEGQASKAQIKDYQRRVGSVLYTAIMIRPDVAFAASQLSRFLTNPSLDHLAAVNWALRYLFGTRFLGIMYSGELLDTDLMIASDASFADDKETRHSSYGYTVSLFGGLIAWKASKQKTVTTSTTEAEMKGVELTAKEVMALQRLFREIQLELGQLWKIFCDNKQTIRLIVGENERISTALRHVDVNNMWLRQEYQKGSFQVEYLETADMPADGMTKNLPRQKFEHFKSVINLQDTRALLDEVE
jgi:hypothetical protein